MIDAIGREAKPGAGSLSLPTQGHHFTVVIAEPKKPKELRVRRQLGKGGSPPTDDPMAYS
jgi:hypothetical protein